MADTKIVGIIQVKGGVGRSTTTVNLAASFAKSGKTLIIDTDVPQGTSASWFHYYTENGFNQKERITCATAGSAKELIKTIQCAYGYDYKTILIDGPPRIAELSRAILMVADLSLVPIAPSPGELWANTDVCTLIDEAKQRRPDLQARTLWTRVQPRRRLTDDMLAADTGLAKMQTIIHHRIAYPETLGRGRSVFDWHDRKAQAEITDLTREIRRLVR